MLCFVDGLQKECNINSSMKPTNEMKLCFADLVLVTTAEEYQAQGDWGNRNRVCCLSFLSPASSAPLTGRPWEISAEQMTRYTQIHTLVIFCHRKALHPLGSGESLGDHASSLSPPPNFLWSVTPYVCHNFCVCITIVCYADFHHVQNDENFLPKTS